MPYLIETLEDKLRLELGKLMLECIALRHQLDEANKKIGEMEPPTEGPTQPSS